MEPINYILDVKSPIEQALRGFALGRQDIEQNQIMAEREQMMDLRAAQEARAVAAAEEQRAAVDAKRAEAERGQAELMRLVDLGSGATADDFLRAYVANPAIRQDLSSLQTMLEAPKLDTMLKTSQDLYVTARQGNVDALRNQLTLQFEAAKNSGDEGMAATYGSALDLLNTDPEKAMQTIGTMNGLTILGIKGPEYLGQIDKQLGIGQVEQTEAVQTLKERARLAGLVEGTPEYRQFMISGGKTPEGMIIESDGAGGFRMVQGAGAANVKPFTEGQSKDVVFATRAKGALDVLEPVAGNLTSLGSRAAELDPTGIIRGRVQSPEYQVAKQAGDEFLQAILRKDTGAAITVPEQALYGVTYLPQPGDGPAVLEAKRAARQRAVAAIEAGMSPAQMIAQERALSGDQPAPADGRVRYDENGDRIK